jgi:hypothetical protein
METELNATDVPDGMLIVAKLTVLALPAVVVVETVNVAELPGARENAVGLTWTEKSFVGDVPPVVKLEIVDQVPYWAALRA